MIYHVLNRANARLSMLETEGDYDAFVRILAEAVDRTSRENRPQNHVDVTVSGPKKFDTL